MAIMSLFFNKLFALMQKVTKRSRLNKNSLNTTSGFGFAARTVPQQTLNSIVKSAARHYACCWRKARPEKCRRLFL
jgi:hypothetical protein